MKSVVIYSMVIRRVALIVLCLGSVITVFGQSWSLNLLDSRSNDTLNYRFSSKQEALNEVDAIYSRMLDDGYLQCELDTVITDSSIVLFLKPNEKFLLRDVYFFRDGLGEGQIHAMEILNRAALSGVFTKSIAEYENGGYPFATIHLDSVIQIPRTKRREGRMDAYVTLNPGPLYVNDSLYVKALQPLPSVYIGNYIDFKSGRPYNEQRVQQTERRLREIPFLQVKRSPEVTFSDGKADLFLFVERKKANYFNGVVGLRPNEETGATTITGDAEVRLLNAFNRGEELGLTWRKLQPLTQDLSVRTMVPYLFRSPMAIDGRVQIYKRDTSFSTVKLLAGTGVILPRNQRIRVFVERNRTDRLTDFYTAGGLANAQHTLYGLSGQLELLDYRWNPRRGYSFQLECATGYRITSLSVAESVVAARRPLTRAELTGEYYLPVFKRQTILIGMKGAILVSDSLYENEVFRIGGLRTIRGINEESIFATAWSVATLEYRWLLEENSCIYVFMDQAWYEYKSTRGYVRDVPIAAGAGFNFETKAGIFTFNYALGKQFDNPILVRNGKISFGFRSLF